jgi:hypothetical protein
VPKTDADKVRDGYVRRSMLNRNTNWLNRHRTWIEPLITNQGFDALAPLIERGLSNQPFAEAIQQLYVRSISGLPLDGPTIAAAAAAVPASIAAAPADGGLDPQTIIDEIQNNPNIDELTKAGMLALVVPVVKVAQAQNARIQTYETQQRTQQEAQQRTQQQTRQQQDAERQLGSEMRRALQEYFPTEFTQTTPGEKYMQVLRFASSSGMFQRYGRTPGTVVLAYQNMNSPTGGQPTSAAAMTVAQVRAQAEAHAAAAAGQVAGALPSGGPEGATAGTAARVEKVPRYITDKRTKQKRALTAKEVGEYLVKHPNATV